jgi:hypothetical protein
VSSHTSYTAAAAAAAYRIRLPHKPQRVQLLPLQLTQHRSALLLLLLLLLLFLLLPGLAYCRHPGRQACCI